MPAGSSFTSLTSTLESVAERFGLASMLLEQRLQRRWADIVGASVAAHTRPDAIRFKKLYLIAENSIWLQQLTFLKPSLVEKINAAAGKPAVIDIILRVGEVGHRPVSALGAGEIGPMRDHVNGDESQPERLHPSQDAPEHAAAEIMAEAAGHTLGIVDTELRAHFTEVMARAVTNAAPTPSRRPAP
jgi:hypothetical protein